MEQIALNRNLANIGVNLFIKHRFLWLLAVILIVIASGYGLQKIRMDSSNESFLPETDALSIANDQFKEIFGNEEFVFILIETDDLFSHESLQKIRDLQIDLEERLPFIDDVNTITNVEFIESVDNNLIVDDILPEEIPNDPKLLNRVKQKLASSKLYLDRIVSEDFRWAGLAITFERLPDDVWVQADDTFSPLDQANWPLNQVMMSEDIFDEPDPSITDSSWTRVVDARKLIAPALKAIISQHQSADFILTSTGIPVADYEVDITTGKEGERVGTIAFVAAFVFMLILFRSAAGVVTPLLVMISTVIVLFGCLGWLGIPVSLGSMIVAPLIMVLSVSYSIHFINHFNFYFRRKGNRLQSIHYSYSQATWPCFLTALTTAIGFTSFMIVSMKPIRDVGIACAAGTIFSYLLVIILVPIGLSFGKDQAKKMEKHHKTKGLPFGMKPLSEWVLSVKMPIIVSTAILIVFSGFYITQVNVEMDFIKVLGDKVQSVKDTKKVTKHLGGYYSYEVLIELAESDAAKIPENLIALSKLTQEAAEFESVTSTMSLVDFVKEINYVMNGRNESFYEIPATKNAIAQYLLLYEMSGGGELDNWVDYDYRTLRLSVQLNEFNKLTEHLTHVQTTAEEIFPAGTKISVVGDVPIMMRLMNLLTIGQVKSIAIAFVFISAVMIFILRSFKAGLISMIPNVLPLAVVGGVMGLTGMNLDLMTIMIAPMIMGIAVDDTVHFFIHFKDELSGFRDYHKANTQTFIKIGHALLFTTVVLSLGFSIFGFSVVTAMVNMGILATIGILVALLADFFITPVMLVYLKPFGQRIH